MTRMELRGGSGSGAEWMDSVERRLSQLQRHSHHEAGTAQQRLVGETPVNLDLVAPSTPTATNDQPQVFLSWNGNGAGDASMPANFREVVVHRGEDADFIPSDASALTPLRAAGTLVFADTPVGVTYWYRLVAYNTAGEQSTASEAVPGTRVAGPVALPSFTTGTRPAPVAGSMVFDSTLGVPVFGDGSVWRRFDGTPA